jgi:glycosyltransferase involved in cell wall biosynthesis
VARREAVVGRAAQGVSLVAEDEAAAFGARIGRPVAWLPMAVDISPSPAPVAANPGDRIVFVGGLDYHANLEAVRTYVGEVAPALAALGQGGLRLRVIGHCPEAVRAELGSSPSVDLLGYVDDLASELAGARAFVAPIPPGTGVKTKVLEAMAAGLPVVSTPDGVTGIGVVPGEHCLVGSTPTELAEGIARLVADPEAAARIGAAGRSIVAERFSRAVVTERWQTVLESLTRGGVI